MHLVMFCMIHIPIQLDISVMQEVMFWMFNITIQLYILALHLSCRHVTTIINSLLNSLLNASPITLNDTGKEIEEYHKYLISNVLVINYTHFQNAINLVFILFSI